MIARDAVRAGHSDQEILRLSRQANRSVFFRSVAVGAVLLLGVLGFAAGRASQHANDKASVAAAVALENRRNLVEFCEAQARPPDGASYIQATALLRQVRQTHAIGVPNLARKFHLPVKLLKVSLKQQRSQAAHLLHPNCEAQFPAR